MKKNLGPRNTQGHAASEQGVSTIANRAPYVELLKKKTLVGPTTRAVNTMCTKLNLLLFLDAQIPVELLGFERFQETMDYLACWVG